MNVRVHLAAVALLGITACQTAAPTPTAEILRMSIARDMVSLDPTQIHQPSVELGLVRNLYNGLYGFDNNLNEVPDLATGMPDVSQDGKTWIFHLRPNANFGNGDPVTADDVIYSWTRDAQVQSSDAAVFEPVVGFEDVNSGKQTVLAGLSAPDAKTVVARLSGPAGFWLVELGIWPAYVLNRRVLRDHGEQDWWMDPQYLNASATGPFQLSQWQRTRFLDFKPTPNWWGGATGTLSDVRAEIVADPVDALARYEHGDLDVIGYSPDVRLPPEIPIDSLHRYGADHTLATQIYRRPWYETFWLRLNTRSGPLAGAAAQPARKALSQAIDRKALVSAMCDGGLTCDPATGGMFLPGLQGYLGDNKDPNAVFDPAAARSAIKGWDPDGTKSRGLRIAAFSMYATMAQELHGQWMANLGLDIPVDVVAQIPTPRPPIVAGINTADYDSPWNWYGGFVNAPTYSSAEFNGLVAGGNAKLPLHALPDYTQAEQVLENDAPMVPLAYLVGVFLVKPRVIGAGGNSEFEYYWKGIRIKSD